LDLEVGTTKLKIFFIYCQIKLDFLFGREGVYAITTARMKMFPNRRKAAVQEKGFPAN